MNDQLKQLLQGIINEINADENSLGGYVIDDVAYTIENIQRMIDNIQS